MATMNKSVPFKDGDNLDLYLSIASEYTVDIISILLLNIIVGIKKIMPIKLKIISFQKEQTKNLF